MEIIETQQSGLGLIVWIIVFAALYFLKDVIFKKKEDWGDCREGSEGGTGGLQRDLARTIDIHQDLPRIIEIYREPPRTTKIRQDPPRSAKNH